MHVTGGIMLAGTRERLDWLKMAKARGRYLGMELEIISVEEAARLFPLMNKRHFVGALLDPIEGHVDPWGVTQAYAKAAQIGGAEIVRHTRVMDLKARRDGTWDVITEARQRARRARRECRRPVGARGRPHGRARAAGARHGAPVPHHRGHSGSSSGQKEQLHCIDFEGEIYTAPGARRHADRHLRACRRAVVAA